MNNERRNLITSASRWSIVSLLTLAGIKLTRKSKKTANENSCTNRQVCSYCRAYKNCSLPAAVSRKKALAKNKNQGNL